MLSVNSVTKTAYQSDSVRKMWTISFPQLNLTFDDSIVVGESVELFESVLEGEDVQFVGCMASRFSVTLRINANTANRLKDAYVQVSVIPDVTGAESIPVFKGYVDSVEMEGNKKNKKITAYDMLYKLSQVDVARWYNTLDFPLTLKEFRDGLFEEINVNQETVALPLDAFSVGKMFEPDKVCALDIIKQICQINCAFGKMNRSGNFEYVMPTAGSEQELGYYKTATYQEYTIKPVDKLTVKYDEVEGSYSTGSGANEYVIQNNMFMTGHTAETLQSVATALFPHVSSFSFMPSDINVNGLPYVECLDTIKMKVLNPEDDTWSYKYFRILSRTMTGMQSLRDNISSKGSEDIHKFISDLQINLEKLEQVVSQIQDDLDNLKFRYFLITNGDKIIVHDNEKKVVVDLYFTATKATTTVFQAEVLCQVETNQSGIDVYDNELQVYYELDTIESTIVPKEDWTDGNHILHLFRYFTISEDKKLAHLKVYFKSLNGKITVNIGELRASLYGQNLVAEDEWNGVFEITEQVSSFNLVNFSFADATESVNVRRITPYRAQPSETVAPITLLNLTFANATDEVHARVMGEMTRLTEDGDTRITEDENTRITEGV